MVAPTGGVARTYTGGRAISSLPSPVASGNTHRRDGIPRSIHLDPGEVPSVFRRAFPSYRGRKFVVEVTDSVFLQCNHWSGGTRYTYRGVDLVTGAVLPPDCDEYGNPFVHPEVPTVALPANGWSVNAST